MAHKLITLKAAAEDISEAYNYYESLQVGLGDRFMLELVKRYNEISIHPQYYCYVDIKYCAGCEVKEFPIFGRL